MKYISIIFIVVAIFSGCEWFDPPSILDPNLEITITRARYYPTNSYFWLIMTFENNGDADAENIQYNLKIFDAQNEELEIRYSTNNIPASIPIEKISESIYIDGWSSGGNKAINPAIYRLIIYYKSPHGKSMAPIVKEGSFI